MTSSNFSDERSLRLHLVQDGIRFAPVDLFPKPVINVTAVATIFDNVTTLTISGVFNTALIGTDPNFQYTVSFDQSVKCANVTVISTTTLICTLSGVCNFYCLTNNFSLYVLAPSALQSRTHYVVEELFLYQLQM